MHHAPLRMTRSSPFLSSPLLPLQYVAAQLWERDWESVRLWSLWSGRLGPRVARCPTWDLCHSAHLHVWMSSCKLLLLTIYHICTHVLKHKKCMDRSAAGPSKRFWLWRRQNTVQKIKFSQYVGYSAMCVKTHGLRELHSAGCCDSSQTLCFCSLRLLTYYFDNRLLKLVYESLCLKIWGFEIAILITWPICEQNPFFWRGWGLLKDMSEWQHV